MSNPLLGEKEIEINGTTFTLRPSFEGLIEIERRAGCSISQLANKIMLGIAGITDVTSIIYGGVFGFHDGKPEITFNKIGEKVMVHGFANLLSCCGQFIASAISGTDINECEVSNTDAKKKDTGQTHTQLN